MFGDNLDVLPPESAPPGGYVSGGARGGMRRIPGEAIELQLDTVFFEDGLCAGPDEFGLFESVTEDLERQRNTAQEIVETLRNGASTGQIFEILRPLARHHGHDGRASKPSPLLWMFASTSIHHLLNMSGPDLLGWFERAAQPSRIQLHRPT